MRAVCIATSTVSATSFLSMVAFRMPMVQWFTKDVGIVPMRLQRGMLYRVPDMLPGTLDKPPPIPVFRCAEEPRQLALNGG
jgi:hypothetical protein